jgi:hypothetical protein
LENNSLKNVNQSEVTLDQLEIRKI